MKTGFRQLCQKNCGRLPIDRADGSQLVPAGFRYGFGENGAGGADDEYY